MAWILWQIVYWWKVSSVSGFLPRSHHFTKTILIRIAGKSRFHLKQLFFTRVQNFTKILRLFEHFSVFTDSKSPTSNVRQTKKIGRHETETFGKEGEEKNLEQKNSKALIRFVNVFFLLRGHGGSVARSSWIKVPQRGATLLCEFDSRSRHKVVGNHWD